MRKSAFMRIIFMKLLTFFLAIQSNPSAAQTFEAPLRKCWAVETPLNLKSEFASDNVSVFLPYPEGILKSVDVRTGEVRWKSELGGEISDLIIDQNKILYVITTKMSPIENTEAKMEKTESTEKSKSHVKTLSISALSSVTGIFRWKTELDLSDTENVYLFERNRFIYLITGKGKVLVLDGDTGKTISTRSENFQTQLQPLFSDQKFYVGDTDGQVFEFVLSAERVQNNASPKSLKKLSSAPTSFLRSGEDLYAGDKTGRIYKINISNLKTDWVARTGGEITDIKAVADRILVSSADNFVYSLSRSNGSRVWKKRLNGNNRQSSVIGDIGVFSPLGDQTVTILELKKGRTVNQISFNSPENNSLVGKTQIFGNMLVISTLQGIYGFSADGCSNPKTNQ